MTEVLGDAALYVWVNYDQGARDLQEFRQLEKRQLDAAAADVALFTGKTDVAFKQLRVGAIDPYVASLQGAVLETKQLGDALSGLTGELAGVATGWKVLTDAITGEWDRTTAEVMAGARAQVGAIHDVRDAYAELAAVRGLTGGGGIAGALPRAPLAVPNLAQAVGGGGYSFAGARGNREIGGRYNPMVQVIEDPNYAGMGALAAKTAPASTIIKEAAAGTKAETAQYGAGRQSEQTTYVPTAREPTSYIPPGAQSRMGDIVPYQPLGNANEAPFYRRVRSPHGTDIVPWSGQPNWQYGGGETGFQQGPVRPIYEPWMRDVRRTPSMLGPGPERPVASDQDVFGGAAGQSNRDFWANMFDATGGGGGGSGGGPPAPPGPDDSGGGFPWSTLLYGGRHRQFGRGRFFPGIPGAAAGSLLSFAGLDPLHALTTAGAVVGSGVSALGGGALLAGGAAAQIGVGGGSDLAILKSTIADTTTLSQALTAVSTAQDTYGKNSRQAAVATAQLDATVKSLGGTLQKNGQITGAPGVAAELKLAKNAQALDTAFDAASQHARVTATDILEQGVKLGTVFMPLMVQAAQQNLAIINNGIKPLFSWLEGPHGIAIWQNLEDNFKKNLPDSVHAFDQGVEVLLKVLNMASNQTGGFVEKLNELLTKLNAEPNSVLQSHVSKLIADFHLWEDLIKNLGLDLYLLFKNDAGTGNSIVQTLDAMLIRLGEWERTTGAKDQLHNIFEVHKNEVLALLGLLPALATGFTHLYLAFAPLLTQTFTTFVSAIGTIVDAIVKLGQVSPILQNTLVIPLSGLLVSMKLFGASAPIAALKATANAFRDLGSAEEEAGAKAQIFQQQSLFPAGANAAKSAEGEAGGMFAGISKEKVIRGVVGGAIGVGIAQGIGDSVKGGLGTAISDIGSGASIGGGLGSMFGPWGTAAGAALGAGIGAAIDIFSHKAPDEGKVWAERFTSSLPNQLNQRVKEGLQKTTDQIKLPSASPFSAVPRTGLGNAANEARIVAEWKKNWEQADKEIAAAGEATGKAWGESMAKGAHPTGVLLTRDAVTALRDVPKQIQGNSTLTKAWQDAAASQMVTYAGKLEDEKKLPVGAVDNMIAAMEQQFPGLTAYLDTQAQGSAQSVAAAFRFKQADNNMIGAVAQFKQHWLDMAIAQKLTAANINTNAAQAMHDLQTIIATTTGQTRQDAENELAKLKTVWATTFQSMTDQVSASMSSMKDAIQANIPGAVNTAVANFENLQSKVESAMSAGTLTTVKGSKMIADALNAMLKAFGSKPIPLPDLPSGNLLGTPGNAPGGRQHVQGLGAARGMIMTMGHQGARGPDTIPISVGGRDIMVGDGEKVAVFNNAQQSVMDSRLSDYGGLDGMFSKVTTPHGSGPRMGYAKGGMVTGTSTVEQAAMEANAITRMHYPYVWGGGHNASFTGPYDCSGAVSADLHAAGLLSAPMVASQFMNYGLPGPGPITIYASPTHVFESINGRFFGTHGADGASWYQGSPLAGFVERHPPGVGGGSGMGSSGQVGTPQVGGTGTVTTLAEDAMKKMAAAANAKIDQVAMASIGGGHTGGGDWGTFQSAGGIKSGSWFNVARQIASKHGWNASQVQDWYGVEQMEDASLSLTAKNPSSSAYGLAQFIDGPGEYYKYGGNPSSIVGQLTAMANYIAGRYGTPSQALAFHRSHPYYGQGGAVESFYGGGAFAPNLRRSRAANTTTTTTPKVPKSKQSKPKLPVRLPKFKALPGSVGNDISKINSIEDYLNNDLTPWQSYITGLHGLNPVQSTVTMPDGSQVVNWFGMADPTTHQHDKGIYERLAEIGDPGPPATTDLNTELGIDEVFLQKYQAQLLLTADMNKKFPAWLMKMKDDLKRRNRQVKDYTAMIDYFTKAREGLANAKRDRTATITRRFETEREKLSEKSMTGTFDATQFMRDTTANLATEQRDALAKVPTQPPSSWLGSTTGWFTAHNIERSLIQDEFAERLTALQDEQAKIKFQGQISASRARLGLSLEESKEKEAVDNTFTTKRNTYNDTIRTERTNLSTARRYVTSDQGYLQTATGSASGRYVPGSGSVEDSLKNVNNPHGPLQIDIDTMKNINIAALLNEISTLKATSIPGTTTTTTDDYITLLQQSNETLANQAKVLAAQYHVLSTMPPFAGSFLTGGVVPGVFGEPKTIVAHAGEEYMGLGGQGKGQPVVQVIVQDGAVDCKKIKTIATGAAVEVTRSLTPSRHTPMPGLGGGLFPRTTRS